MRGMTPKPRRRRQKPFAFFMTALVIAVAIFLVAELIQWQPWRHKPSRQAPASQTAAVAGAADNIAGFKIFLRRDGCGGGCPYYALMAQKGSLRYVGVRDVKKQGAIDVAVSQQTMRSLLKLVQRASFFALADSYDLGRPGCRAAGPGAPSITVGVTLNDQTKVVKANLGCADVPARLIALARGIDRVTNSAQWTGVPATGAAPSGT